MGYAHPHGFYYTPEHIAAAQKQGFYTPQPASVLGSVPDYFGHHYQPYHRPQSAGGRTLYQPTPQYMNHMLTPSASPKAFHHKPAPLLLQQENPYMIRLDASQCVPSTPTLSASSGSSFCSNSATTPDMQNTGADGDYFARQARKEEDVFSADILCGDIVAVGSTQSPPLTPGKQPHSIPAHHLMR